MRPCVVKNEASEYLTSLVGNKPVFGKLNADCVLSERDAQMWANETGGHVVPLAELEPVEVSEEEAEMLKTLDGDLMPIGELAYFIHHAEQLSEKESIKREDRLMRAYVNGWTVEKPKLWNVKVPHTDDSFYYKIDDEFCNAALSTAVWFADEAKFTNVEIEKYDLTDCERVEVTDDEQ